MSNLLNRQRASDTPPDLQGLSRTQARDQVIEQFMQGDLTQGELLKKLRIEVLGIKQEEFAKLVKVSRKTISDVENDNGNYSINTINQIFRPFGLVLKLGYR
ncbi:transcriptional regulator [Moraxella atlantae]|uniref:Transcriptional regulator n=1 Tax=Faucicola atlantae TaxID=34059 RepID=A0A1B8QBC2_9GAMM|nr:helix-turn-helix domain-containing protein [Moraxella atlantae]OBX77048.1 transcriptional regulator [Moraxella atlantae]